MDKVNKYIFTAINISWCGPQSFLCLDTFRPDPLNGHICFLVKPFLFPTNINPNVKALGVYFSWLLELPVTLLKHQNPILKNVKSGIFMDTHGILSVRDFFGDGNIIFYGILTFEIRPSLSWRLKQNVWFYISWNCVKVSLCCFGATKLPNYGICLFLLFSILSPDERGC